MFSSQRQRPQFQTVFPQLHVSYSQTPKQLTSGIPPYFTAAFRTGETLQTSARQIESTYDFVWAGESTVLGSA
jgi:hypothetical protein